MSVVASRGGDVGLTVVWKVHETAVHAFGARAVFN